MKRRAALLILVLALVLWVVSSVTFTYNCEPAFTDSDTVPEDLLYDVCAVCVEFKSR